MITDGDNVAQCLVARVAGYGTEIYLETEGYGKLLIMMNEQWPKTITINEDVAREDHIIRSQLSKPKSYDKLLEPKRN